MRRRIFLALMVVFMTTICLGAGLGLQPALAQDAAPPSEAPAPDEAGGETPAPDDAAGEDPAPDEADAPLAPQPTPSDAPLDPQPPPSDAQLDPQPTPEPVVSQEPFLDATSLGGDPRLDVEEFSLEDLLAMPVETATRFQMSAKESPAVVTVVSRDEIQRRGYTSLAEVLRSVPGFYDVYDLVTHNIAVRGVNGGARASGNVVKLMIDGQAVPFHSNTGNFFGEELIPLEAVERIEIIRGPASALYGANAFLGVINVITRDGSTLNAAHALARSGVVREHPSFGAGLVMGAGDEAASFLIAGHWLTEDRSGLQLASTSPVFDRQDTRDAVRGVSKGDVAEPAALLATAALGKREERGRWSALASVQMLDAAGEFSDLAPLTHQTHVALFNQHYRLGYEVVLQDTLHVEAFGTYFRSAPGDQERLSSGRSDVVYLRNVDARGFEVGLEGSVELIDSALVASLGADFQLEDHQLQTYDQLLLEDVNDVTGRKLRTAGTIIPSDRARGDKTFDNAGVFAQAYVRLAEAWSLTGGLRVDHHNIYKTQFSPRFAVVWTPAQSAWHAKLLLGTSFKAPSAEQLYTNAMKELDIRGNAELGTQNAQTGELLIGWEPSDWAELLVNGYLTRIAGRVAYVQRGLWLSAENEADELLTGAEVVVQMTPFESFRVRLAGDFSDSLLQTRSENEVVLSALQTEMPLSPRFQVFLSADWRIPGVDCWIAPEAVLVGPRSASQSNVLERNQAYEHPSYLFLALAVTTPEWRLFGEHSTQLRLRVNNLTNAGYGDPGFAGIDVPNKGINALLTLEQEL